MHQSIPLMLGSVGSKHGLRPYGVPPRGPCAVVGGYCVGGGLNVAPLPLSLILLLFLVPLVFLFCIFFVSALHFTLYILIFAAVIYLYCYHGTCMCTVFKCPVRRFVRWVKGAL